MFRHVRLLLMLAAGVTAAVLLLRGGSPAAAPGGFVSWAPAQATAQASPAPAGTVQPVPVASATPTPAPGLFGALQVPLTSLFEQLNAETRTSAAGQYTMLQELESALGQRIDQFLEWVSGGR